MSQEPTPLESYIRQRLQRKKMLLMTHAVVGYPDLDANMRMLEAMQQADVDLVELQLPFSEPIADGPVFLRANQGALDAGMNWERYFQLMQRASRAFDFKVLMMGYYNSVFRMGHETFCNCLSENGGSGFIVADFPPQAGRQYKLHFLCLSRCTLLFLKSRLFLQADLYPQYQYQRLFHRLISFLPVRLRL
jgi:tryptophan synthase alpha chain